MSLKSLRLAFEPRSMETGLAEFLSRVDEEAERVAGGRPVGPHPRYVSSDFRLAHAALCRIREENLAVGNRFLEWGSGLGAVTVMAARAGFEAVGIEIRADLVSKARSLAAGFGVAAEFVEGSFLPAGFDLYHDPIGDSVQLLESPHPDFSSGWYEPLDAYLEDFDLVYAYPWPGETQMMDDLFDRAAASGALLLSFRENGEMNLQRRA